jgi:hypothetical protein
MVPYSENGRASSVARPLVPVRRDHVNRANNGHFRWQPSSRAVAPRAFTRKLTEFYPLIEHLTHNFALQLNFRVVYSNRERLRTRAFPTDFRLGAVNSASEQKLNRS